LKITVIFSGLLDKKPDFFRQSVAFFCCSGQLKSEVSDFSSLEMEVVKMFGRICPFCKETVKKNAVVCRYCGRDLDVQESCGVSGPCGLFAALVGLTAGAALALGLGYWKERRRWEDKAVNDFSYEEADE